MQYLADLNGILNTKTDLTHFEDASVRSVKLKPSVFTGGLSSQEGK